jgi:hypothetical protein
LVSVETLTFERLLSIIEPGAFSLRACVARSESMASSCDTTAASVDESPASRTGAVPVADFSTSASDETPGFPVYFRARRSHSGGSFRERAVRVLDIDTVREWTLRPKEKNGMDSPSGDNNKSVSL